MYLYDLHLEVMILSEDDLGCKNDSKKITGGLSGKTDKMSLVDDFLGAIDFFARPGSYTVVSEYHGSSSEDFY